ncbi:PREDICTED: NEDD8-activating enzyme E1 regulatory subunit-like [Priapulus caudatus]|uniref:NEDD8-activating enzyme E1 regulatory subunit-like n=1 Tax=Priapulus caudatus TaxID=37621 RepID=A0ABM1FAV5_PRICU|nr:PREDICTED: NEDD8-activating enzyme E1 regulatory subunit-like [Priapulus caudatus]
MWLTKESKAFWIMARAVKDFVDNEGGGSLPLRGTLPDMTADSDRYVALQGVYRARARRDLERVRARVNAQLQQLGLPAARVDDDDLCRFCRGAAFLHVTRCRSLAQEHARAAADAAAPPLEGAAADDGDDNATVWYVLLRAVGRFRGEHSRYPGARAGEVETDIALLKACASRLLAEWGLPAIARDDHIHEVCRYGAAELASVAALVGGASAQEAIKVVTQQFVPLNNTYIYSGITQTSTTLEV